MTYRVSLGPDRDELVHGANAYQLEGPLTTFFRTAPGKQQIDCWAVRLASFRTADVRAIRLVDDALIER
jgi:hypothetical protein